jgi:peptide/nickel transport system substrate-binding protein
MLNRRTLLATAQPWHRSHCRQAPRAKEKRHAGDRPHARTHGPRPHRQGGAEISEVVLYNIFETLTKINSDGSVTPLLADSWEVSPDLKTYTFKLKRGVKFQNGEPFNAQSVKFSFDRAAAANSTNKDKRTFANLARRWSTSTPWC